jgi:hypothetical protein
MKYVLAAVATLLRYSTVENSIGTVLLVGNASAARLWFQAPTVFVMELQCAYNSHREPNNAMQAPRETHA